MASSSSSSSRFQGLTKDQLARAYICLCKGMENKKIKTIKHMIQKVKLSFHLSSYNKLQSEMTVLEKQIITMCEIAEQLIAMKTDLASDHDRESLEFDNCMVKTSTLSIDTSNWHWTRKARSSRHSYCHKGNSDTLGHQWD